MISTAAVVMIIKLRLESDFWGKQLGCKSVATQLRGLEFLVPVQISHFVFDPKIPDF